MSPGFGHIELVNQYESTALLVQRLSEKPPEALVTIVFPDFSKHVSFVAMLRFAGIVGQIMLTPPTRHSGQSDARGQFAGQGVSGRGRPPRCSMGCRPAAVEQGRKSIKKNKELAFCWPPLFASCRFGNTSCPLCQALYQRFHFVSDVVLTEAPGGKPHFRHFRRSTSIAVPWSPVGQPGLSSGLCAFMIRWISV